ncbi:hypothetical protein LSAT2_022067 [Lamellibrachia satsuma]|nr:hypothetical protein LSAT2_022067 [Lamellibrachia satsuma]
MAEPDLDQLPGGEVSFLSRTTSRKIRDGENFSEAAIAVSSGHFDKQKRITLLFCILPVTLLLCLSTSFLFVEVRAHLAGQRLRVNVRFAARLSDVIHNLQQERDMTAFFLSSQTSQTKADLDKLYGETDISLVGLDTWPADNMPTEQFKSKSNFQRILNEHRASVNASASASASTAVTYNSEITFYSGLISEMMNWLVKSINIPEASIMYEDLVALQQAMEAKDAFGLERAYGVVCLTIGGFRNRSDHWDFTDSQATADITFKSAVEYSDLLRDNYHIYVTKENRLADAIKQMRNEISKMKVLEDENLLQPSVERALLWFDNMTIYIDAVFVMTVNVRQTIIDRVSISEEYDTIRLSGICVVLLVILALCGVIGWEVNELMKEYEQSCVMLANR